MTRHHVYGLYERFDNTPFYIGVTKNPAQRLSSHRSAANGTRADSLTGCGVKGKDISMRLLADCDDRNMAELIETCLIEHFKIVVVNKKHLYKPHGT